MCADVEQRKQAVMNSIRQELAMSSVQELITVRAHFARYSFVLNHRAQKINEKCFKQCITKPSTSLSGSEEVRASIVTFSVIDGIAGLPREMSWTIHGSM